MIIFRSVKLSLFSLKAFRFRMGLGGAYITLTLFVEVFCETLCLDSLTSLSPLFKVFLVLELTKSNKLILTCGKQ